MRLLKVFTRPIQLVVHGGAVMILHPTLASSTTRRTTRDVDFIQRSFVVEMRKYGVFDAEARLQSCIDATAARYRLGTDWFNSHADIALPMAQECVFTHSHLIAVYSENLNIELFTLPVHKACLTTQFTGMPSSQIT
jgi:hypothetical protein